MTIATDLERSQLVIELQHEKIAELTEALAAANETLQKAEARVKQLDERVAQRRDLLRLALFTLARLKHERASLEHNDKLTVMF